MMIKNNDNIMRRTNRIRLTESQLHHVIEESIAQVLMENEMEEGLWNQMKSGFNGFMGTNGKQQATPRLGNMQWKNRFKSAISGFQNQGKLDDSNELTNDILGAMEHFGVTKDEPIAKLLNKMQGARGQYKSTMNKASNKMADEYALQDMRDEKAFMQRANALNGGNTNGQMNAQAKNMRGNLNQYNQQYS